jgi:hypothetical protein
VSIDFDQEHVVDLEMGSLYPPGDKFPGLSDEKISAVRNRYRVWLDGKLLINVPRNFQPSESDEVVCALNTIGASTAEEMFSGSIGETERIKPPPLRNEALWGPVDALVRFPQNMTGQTEPIVVTGIAGKGDFIFVRYEDAGRIRFGFDHWSVGGRVGNSVAVDMTKPHHLEVTMGSLYPPTEDRLWLAHPAAPRDALKAKILVRLDNVVVLDAESPTYEVQPDQITLWRNPIGGSSCRVDFTGAVVKSGRAEW